EIFVHFGTLLAIFVVFRNDIWKIIKVVPALPSFLLKGMRIQSEEDEFKALTLFIIIGSIPAGFVGLLFEEQIQSFFESSLFVLFMLFVTGLINLSSHYTNESTQTMKGTQAFLIGIAQAFAIIPGISRSGSTIVTALWMGINRERAARFSFLLSIPVILGPSILKFGELLEAPPATHEIVDLIAGTLAAAISGYFAIIWLLDIVKRKKLEWFGIYCIALSLLGLIIFLI
ncbi:MAG: undecaprenyl-diphosphate phosphatase, partial [Calditrichia bacterium]